MPLPLLPGSGTGANVTLTGIGPTTAVGQPLVVAEPAQVVLVGVAPTTAVGQPLVGQDQEVTLVGIAPTTAVGQPAVALGSIMPPVPAPRIAAALYTRAGVLLATLSGSYARTWLDSAKDTGSGSLVLQNDDVDLALVDYSTVVRFSLDAVERFAILVERKARISVTEDEEVAEATTITGRGLAGIFDEAVIEPVLGTDRKAFQDTRYFNFASPDMDHTAWAAAVLNMTDVHAGQPDPANGWPEDAAQWIWDRDGPTFDPVNGPPLGWCYFWEPFTVVTECQARISVAADDTHDTWLDGNPLVGEDLVTGYHGEVRQVTVTLDAGTHYLAAACRNVFPVRAGLRITCEELAVDPLGTPGTVLAHTDTGWQVLAYPPGPPGFSPGAVIRILVEEAQARGALVGVVLSFTDSLDSAGNAWPVVADISAPVGSSLTDLLRQLGETYIDWHMAPDSFTLYAYGIGARGAASTTVLAAGVNLTELVHTGEG